jgi:hypothetical protein
MAAASRLDYLLTELAPAPIDGHEGMGALVRVDSDYDHRAPSMWLHDKASNGPLTWCRQHADQPTLGAAPIG